MSKYQMKALISVIIFSFIEIITLFFWLQIFFIISNAKGDLSHLGIEELVIEMNSIIILPLNCVGILKGISARRSERTSKKIWSIYILLNVCSILGVVVLLLLLELVSS